MVTIENLSFSYYKSGLLLNGLNLTLNKGHIYGLLGKNGAGKSTLLKNMAGLAFPKTGSCTINGMNVSSRSVSILEDIYFIAEDLFVPSLTPMQFVANTAGFYPAFNINDYFSFLKLLEVDSDLAMDKLSFGQQKKAMIAFGLASNTKLLMMDEPTNGLDIPSKVQFRKLIASVLTEERCIVISTHQVRDLDSLIDTILILNDQEIVVNKGVDQIIENVSFGRFDDTKGMEVLYEEEGMRGKNVIVKNTSGNFSKIDLELLFNAATSGNPTLLKTLNAN